MANLALYRKYRPQTFEEVIGQEHVTRTLRNALQDGRVVHAYLFAGPRGTGKTSTARLLAKAVNCLDEDLTRRPCNRCAICQAIQEGHLLDLIEIDAASNRGIDEIREIREKVNFRPNEARYKVYVVDEVHMLTEHAFNALLKTLEEPPPHALFVLATTDPQKVPATVASRCQHFEFRRISLAALMEQLRYIANQEGIQVEPAALELVARQATGSMRDAVSLLDQLVSFCGDRVTLADVEVVLGVVPGTVVAALADALLARDLPLSLRLVNQLAHGGTELTQFARALVEYLRGLLLLRVGDGAGLLNRPAEEVGRMQGQAQEANPRQLLRLLRLFQGAVQEMKGDLLSQIPLELACTEACLGADAVAEPAPQQNAVRPASPAPMPSLGSLAAVPGGGAEQGSNTPKGLPEASPHPPEPPRRPEPATPEPVGTAEASKGPTPAGPPAPDASRLKAAWGQVLAEVRPHSRQVEAMLRGSCEPLSVDDGVVTIGFYHEFHKAQVEEQKNRELVQEAIGRVLGAPHRIRCVLTPRSPTEKPKPATRPPVPKPPPPQPEEGETAPQEAVAQEDLPRPHQAVTRDPLIQEAVTRYGAQVGGIVKPPGSGQPSAISKDRAPDGDA
ncbi:MAG: DNA polymerase III subunit gamma/tau [Anaerolineae bacterium]